MNLVSRIPQGISGRFQALKNNPVAVKELRSRMRGRRAFIVLTLHVAFMSLMVSLIYAPFAYAATQAPATSGASSVAGKVVFGGVLLVQVFMVSFVAPAFTSSAISGEKERQSYQLLRTTLLSPKELVTGKIISALSYIFLLIIAAIPLQGLAFLLGGVSIEELVVAQILVSVAAITFAMVGLFFSTLARSTQASTALTFVGTLFLTIGVPLLLWLTIAIQEFVRYNVFYTHTSSYSMPASLEVLFNYLILTLVSLNLPGTIIMSEVTLLNENTLFFFKVSMSGSISIWLVSPWILFTLFYLFLAWLLYRISLRRIARIPNR